MARWFIAVIIFLYSELNFNYDYSMGYLVVRFFRIKIICLSILLNVFPDQNNNSGSEQVTFIALS